MSVHVKICGITTEQDAEAALAAGADLLGLNLIPSSKRYVAPAHARRLVQSVGGRAQVIGVVADLTPEQAQQLRAETGVHALQHHGSESAEMLERMAAEDFKAVRIADAHDVALALTYRGPRLLLDAKVGNALGGTGHVFDWSLIGDLVQQRQVLLAGGLTPNNVAQAVRSVRPWAVDVASGVESKTPFKDPALLARFVEQARSAG